ncbi:microtubule-associated protein 10 [Scyliorhinus canicula]|uniref:microtubule-associated protein 10 n=1 Tax=Scyliorhinus canicula TaxID=7830 RepID=UPI0018F623C7|nr:microtubule-associated protein 10 [Scyliorhinus canicula]
MSAANAPTVETLFSLELLVDYVQLEPRPWTGPGPGPLLAVAFRLLDFPTLLVHQTEPERAECMRRSWDCSKNNGGPEQLPDNSDIPFGKGKSCLFKISLDSLHSHLSNTPLYAMLLDVFPRVPKLLGSCLISLADGVEKVRRDVEEHSTAIPSVHGSKGLHALRNLMGEKIGHISVGYRLLSLGGGLLPHIPENQVLKVGVQHMEEFTLQPVESPVLPNEPPVPEQVEEDGEKAGHHVTRRTPSHSAKSPDLVLGDQALVHAQIGESEVPVVIAMSKEKKRKPNKLAKGAYVEQSMGGQSMDMGLDNVFCPPPMYYSRSTCGPGEKLMEVHIVESKTESAPLEELGPDKVGSLAMHQNLNYSSRSETTSRLKPHTQRSLPQLDPGNIRQLPLLNALLIELSLLHDQVPQKVPLAIHPQLAWLYSGLENDSSNFHKSTTSIASDCPRSTSSNVKKHNEKLKHPMSLKRFDKENTTKQTTTKKDSEHPKKLMYGLTHTLRLRLQQTNPNMLILHDQRELLRKRQLKERRTTGPCYKGKGERGSLPLLKDDQHLPGTFSFQSGHFEENIETLIQNSVDFPHYSKVLRNEKNRYTNNFGAKSEPESAISKEQMCVQTLGPLNHCVELSDSQKSKKETNDRILFGKDVTISLPKISNHDYEHSVSETCNEVVDMLQSPGQNPGFTIDVTIGESCDAQISLNGYNGSPDPKYSEDFTSPEATGLSDDFTSSEPTSRYTDKVSSGIEATSTRLLRTCIYSNDESESSLSKDFGDGQRAAQSEREDYSVMVPTPSERSPIRSLRGTYIVKSHQKVAASNLSDDTASSTEGNQVKNILNPTNKEENKKHLESNRLQGSRLDISPVSTEVPRPSNSTTGCKSLEGSQSLGTSQVSSYVPSSVSDLACSGLEINTADIAKENVSELDAMGIVNECRHISELIVNRLPGYTL